MRVAMKAGTSSLHYYLKQHPQIFMTKIKELNYFSLYPDNGIDWYASHFRGGVKIQGETSPSYTDYPFIREVPERMHALVPEAKLIYSVRHPVERIISHYRHWYSEGKENRCLSEALQDIEDSPYLNLSKYYMQLEQYLPYYSPAQIMIVSQDDLFKSRHKTLRQVFSFLDVDTAFDCREFAAIRNNSKDNRRKNKIGTMITRFIDATGLRKLSSDFAWKIELYLCYPFSHPVNRPVVDVKIKQNIMAHLQDDLGKLQKFTGRDFPEWSMD
jgi:hypothetical protein